MFGEIVLELIFHATRFGALRIFRTTKLRGLHTNSTVRLRPQCTNRIAESESTYNEKSASLTFSKSASEVLKRDILLKTVENIDIQREVLHFCTFKTSLALL